MLPSIVRLGDPALRFPAPAVEVEKLAAGVHRELIETMKSTLTSLGARSLAAPQLGAELQILAFGPQVKEGGAKSAAPWIVVNPMLEPEHGDLIYDWEGCLSIPDLRGLVPRYPAVRLRGFDETGAALDLQASGETARILQHAHDHLGGVVFLDRMRDLRSLAFGAEWREFLSGQRSGEGNSKVPS